MIARKSFLVFLNMVAGSILGYLALFFILRYMNPVEYGTVASGMAYVGLFAFITNLGFDAAHIKRVSEGRDLDKCVGTYMVIKLVLIGIMVGLVVSSILFWKYVVGRGFETAEHEPVIYLFIVYYVILALSSIPLNTFSARRETAKQQLPSFMEPVTRVPVAILVALGSLGVIALAGSYLIGVAAVLIMSLIVFRGYSFGKFDKEMFKLYLKFALPLAVSSGVVLISLNVDKVMLQLFWGSRYVGYYFGVQKLTMFLISMSVAVTMLLFPTLSEHHGKKENEKIKKLTIAAERYVSLIVLPCAVLLIVFARPLLLLFDRELADNATTILRIMAIYALITCFYLIFFNQLMAINRPVLIAKISVTMHVINIGLNLILIPKDIKSLGIRLFGMGAEGAALATAISAVFGLIMYKYYTRKITGTKWNPRILLHLGAAFVMGVALFLISTIFSIWEWFEPVWAGIFELFQYAGVLLLLSILGICIYLGILTLVKEFTKADLKLFLNIINPKGMGEYVASELKNKNKKNNKNK